MKQAQDGDKEAYNLLLSEVYPAISRLLKSKYGALATEDMVQECLIGVHRSRHTYDPSRKFRPWLFTVVKYKSIDVLRKWERKEKQETYDSEKIATIASEETNIEESGGAMEQLNQAMEKLSPDMRQAIVLTKIEGLSTTEAAEKEGVSPVAMRSRVSRAYKILRKSVEREIGK